VEVAKSGPKGRKSRPKAETGSKPPPHQLGVWGSTVISTSGVRRRTTTTQSFPLYSALGMASPDIIILLIVDHKN